MLRSDDARQVGSAVYSRLGRGIDIATSPAVAALVAVTDEAKRALGDRRDVRIGKLPFKVGRESRSRKRAAKSPTIEQRLGVASQVNDVYLMEPLWADLLHISREHFSIEREGDQFFVRDRGSVCGTMVGGTHIGGHRTGGRAELRDGDLITVGTSSSDYVFRFEIASIGPESFQ
jgi:hypothetical protein